MTFLLHTLAFVAVFTLFGLLVRASVRRSCKRQFAIELGQYAQQARETINQLTDAWTDTAKEVSRLENNYKHAMHELIQARLKYVALVLESRRALREAHSENLMLKLRVEGATRLNRLLVAAANAEQVPISRRLSPGDKRPTVKRVAIG